jgi:hypothetical protein
MVVTWQDLAGIALDLATELPLRPAAIDVVRERLNAHYRVLGLFPDGKPLHADGEAESYKHLRSIGAAKQVADWLVGSEMFFAARRKGAIVSSPYDWLQHEMPAMEWSLKKVQTTADRSRSIWLFR